MHLAQRSSLIYFGLTLVWSIIIFVLSTLPGEQLPEVKWLLAPDKFGHAGVYGVLAVGIFYSLRSYHQAGSNDYYWSLLLAAGYGVTMEWVQYGFFPDRYFEFWDIVANIIGAFTALVVLKIIYH